MAERLRIDPRVALKLWTTPRKRNYDPKELTALEKYREELQ